MPKITDADRAVAAMQSVRSIIALLPPPKKIGAEDLFISTDAERILAEFLKLSKYVRDYMKSRATVQ